MAREDNPSVKSAAAVAAIAAFAGYMVGILTAPRSGKETRENIAAKASEIRYETESKIESIREDIEDLIDEAKDRAIDMKDRARSKMYDAVDEAKEARRKAGSVLKAVRNGEADDNDLNQALKNARRAKDKLADYLKK